MRFFLKTKLLPTTSSSSRPCVRRLFVVLAAIISSLCQILCRIVHHSSSLPISIRLPTSLLHTRNLSLQSIHPKLKLYHTLASIRLLLLFLPILPVVDRTHPSHPNISKNTLPLASHNTPIHNLRRPRITMHLM